MFQHNARNCDVYFLEGEVVGGGEQRIVHGLKEFAVKLKRLIVVNYALCV